MQQQALEKHMPMLEPDAPISQAIDREYTRLRSFIRRRVADPGDAEDILQDVFYELVAAYRMMQPIEQVTAWLFRVARNRIIDLFRRRQREQLRAAPQDEDATTASELLDSLPSPEAGPEAARMRNLLLEELNAALDELPEEQREVFVAHELMGYSFTEIAGRTGVGENTLRTRKYYAVQYLRERLRDIYDEFVQG
jgi:RNA polymerase sigma factor (sigma-70 family)